MTDIQLYSVEFFDLQLRFAVKVSELTGLPLAETVGSRTNIYVRLGMGQRLDHANPDWVEYVSALLAARDRAALTHNFHRRRAHLPTGPAVAATVGCFSFAPIGPGRVRLHFHAGHQHSDSPLSLANEHLRRGELTRLVSQVAALGSDVQIVGASWLYNLNSYRRLFPESYLSGLVPMEHPYERMPLWGQFLKRDKTVRADAVEYFTSRLTKATTLEQLSSCFPQRVLCTSAPARRLLAHAETLQGATL
jgi:hypothetical protein